MRILDVLERGAAGRGLQQAIRLEEAADLASFIVSQANSFTTGFCYDLSGGRAVY
jgi:hypothetical protein